MIALTTLEIFLAAILAGLLGSLTGLGGGVLLTPLFVIFLKSPLQLALGASLISTIATSSGAAASYVRDRLSNLSIGLSLEIGTTAGAITGSFLLYYVQRANMLYSISIIFGLVLIFSAIFTLMRINQEISKVGNEDYFTRLLKLKGRYRDDALQREIEYSARNYPFGVIAMYIAGIVSGLLGIGSGAFKVLAMDVIMSLPFKVSTATSNFMIGVTAATSSGLYWKMGFIDLLYVAATIPGVLIGSTIGTRYLNRLASGRLRLLLMAVLIVLGLELILKGLGVSI